MKLNVVLVNVPRRIDRSVHCIAIKSLYLSRKVSTGQTACTVYDISRIIVGISNLTRKAY
jgi:hypothetical protein